MAFFKGASSAATVPASTASPLYSFPSALSFSVPGSFTWLYTTVAILCALLVLEQGVYRAKKGSLPGDKWTIPVIGKFADSMKPSMENYKKQWDSGVLSAVSVFNM
jgi:C-22 sterol desaturase